MPCPAGPVGLMHLRWTGSFEAGLKRVPKMLNPFDFEVLTYIIGQRFELIGTAHKGLILSIRSRKVWRLLRYPNWYSDRSLL